MRLTAESDEPFAEPVRQIASVVVVETVRQMVVIVSLFAVAEPQFAVALRLHIVGASVEIAVAVLAGAGVVEGSSDVV